MIEIPELPEGILLALKAQNTLQKNKNKIVTDSLRSKFQRYINVIFGCGCGSLSPSLTIFELAMVENHLPLEFP